LVSNLTKKPIPDYMLMLGKLFTQTNPNVTNMGLLGVEIA